MTDGGGCRLCAAQWLVEFGGCARALCTQRAEGGKAAEGKPMQWFLSTFTSILQTLRWTKSKNVANYMSQAGAEASQVRGESQVVKAEADPAYVNLKVKQQVAFCRGSISISIDTVFRMAQLPISELSAAHNSKRYSACSFCLPSFFA